MPQLRILVVFGTRPEAIKMAPVVTALKHQKDMAVAVAVTAQHREMLDQVLKLFEIIPDYDLDIMRPGQTLVEVTSRSLEGLGRIYAQARPDLVLVHGDTTTTLAGSLAAFYQRIPVGHVEAGLRTRDKYAPFPEEMNRHLTGALADLHFAPTATARANLLAEGIDPGAVFVTGNTVIDALLTTVSRPCSLVSGALQTVFDHPGRVVLLTAHRRENWGQPLQEIFEALHDLLEAFPDLLLVFPVHKNPIVGQTAQAVLGAHPRAVLLDPLDYLPFTHLLGRVDLLLTDSGGLQEEAPALGKPVLVLREVTERPEAVEAGTVRLVGTGRDIVFREAARLLSDESSYAGMANAVNPYGDGQAAARIVAVLRFYCLGGPPPEEFEGISKKYESTSER